MIMYQSKADEYGISEATKLLDRIVPEAKAKLPAFLIDSLPIDKIKMWVADMLARAWEQGYQYRGQIAMDVKHLEPIMPNSPDDGGYDKV
jgi:hypothetical protein